MPQSFMSWNTTLKIVEYQRHDAKSEAWPTVNRMTSSTTKQHECTRIQKIGRSSIDVQHHPRWAWIRASRVVSSIKRLGATEQSRATRGQQKLQLSDYG